MALYNATDGPNWTNNTNWLSSEPVGDWYGVTVRNGRVAELSLHDNGLTGAIPSQLGNLSSLETLGLGRNQLTGSIPSELGNLSSLETLALFVNDLTGTIPAQLGNLSSLYHLNLENNQLTGSIPSQLGNLSRLRSLHLRGNRLTGTIPSELGNLANLELLTLFDNRLTGTIPTWLGNLTSLEWLRLSGNQLTGTIPTELGNLVKLTDLWLGRNRLTGSIPTVLGNLTSLEWLLLESNQLTGTIPPELGNLANLEQLRLNNNQLTGNLPGSFTNLAALERFLFYLNPGLCAQDNSTIQTWLNGIDDVQGPDCSPTVRLSVNPSRLVEGAGTTPVTVTANRAAVSNSTTVSLRLGGSAKEGTGRDYTRSGAPSITIPANATSGTTLLTFTPLDDGLAESDENIILEAIVGTKTEGSVTLLLLDQEGAESACAARDQVALEALYNTTGGPNWTNNTNWLSDQPLSEWHGVTVDGNGCVTELRLVENKLIGSIPPQLGNLGSLLVLNLSGNQLTGSIPAELGNLENLNQLFLIGNQLAGSIPAELGNLAYLQELLLTRNQLTGSIPAKLSNLANLVWLDLRGNQLTGTIPVELASLANLVRLWIGGNQLTGSIPAELGNLENLRGLYLFRNQLTGPIPAELGNLENLRVLGIGDNRLTGTIPAALGNLENLQRLSLDNNQLTGTIPQSFTNLGALELFYFDLNPGLCAQDSGPIRAWLNGVTHVRGPDCTPTVRLSVNPSSLFEDSGATPVTVTATRQAVNTSTTVNLRRGGSAQEGAGLDYTVSGTESITIPANATSGTTLLTFTPLADGLAEDDENIILEAVVGTKTEGSVTLPLVDGASSCAARDRAALEALYNATGGPNWTNNTNWLSDRPLSNWHGVTADSNGCVTGLELSQNQLTGAIPTQLANLANLEFLNLDLNQLTGAIPTQLGNLANLEDLNLGRNRLTGTIPSELANLANLGGLYLGHNQLTGAIPTQLANLANLEFLYLTDNQLTGAIPTQLANLVNLEILALSDNRLTGSIPSQLGNLVNLEILALSDNQLTGSIPSQLGNLVNLEILALSDNQLTGSIPSQLGDLANLQRLIFDNNQLTGAIPTQLGNLTNLRHLILGKNQLTGAVPTWLASLANLEQLWLSSNQLTGTIPAQLGKLANLKTLGLSGNKLTGTIPTELGSLTNLGHLSLDNNQLTGAIPAELGNLDNLRALWIEDNRLTGTIPQSFINLEALEVFFFNLNPGLCAQDSGPIRAWLNGVTHVRGPDCTPTVRLSVNPSSLFEDSGATPVTVTATRQAVNTSTTVNLRRGGSAQEGAGLDYTVSGTESITIPANATSGTTLLTFTPLADGLAEDDENIILEAVVGTKTEGSVTLPLVDGASSCAARDRAALEALYNATGGPNWTNNTNWLSDRPLSNWHGVTADSNGCVTGLELFQNQLTGAIPSQLGNLADLRVLDLSRNQLTGSIFPEADNRSISAIRGLGNDQEAFVLGTGSLSKLERLDLSQNQLTGSIPPQLGNLANLTEVSVGSNRITGSIPPTLGGLANLERLDLSDNQLTGTIPSQLGNLASLTDVSVGSNQITGSIPPTLGGLANLERLDLSDNQITGSIPPQLGNLASLTEVSVGSNRITGSIPPTLGGLANLERLDLSDNQLTGSIPSQIGNLDNLVEMWLYDNQLADNIPPELGNLALLEELLLHNNQLTGSIPTQLGNLDNLTEASLGSNQLTGSIPPALGGLSNLERLDLSDNQLTGTIPSQLGNLTNLVEMWLYDNQLAGNIPPELGNLALLEQLLLHNNHLTGSIPPSFTNLGALEFFSFYGNTNLIVPDDPALQAWLDGITNVQGPGDVTPKPTSAHFVPVILTASGRNNSFFTSELTLTNRGSQAAPLQYTYTAAAGGGSGQASETLAPGRQKIVPNAIDYLRTLGVPIPGSGNRIGTLRVAVSGSDVGVTARTTTRVADGRAGLAYPGIAVADGFTEAVYLCGLRQNVQDRSNVAFQNMGTSQEGSITLRTTVFSGDANAPGSQALPDVTLAPGGFHQYSGLLATAGIAQGYVKVERVSGGAPFYAYGVINDQANSDGSFVFPVTASSLAGVRGQTLPVIIEHPNFSSELIVTNFSNSTKEFSFHFVADAITTPDKTVSSAGDRMASGAQWIIPNFVQAMRAGGFEGIGSRGRTIAGAAFFEAVSGDLSGVVIGARTGSPGGGGQYSVFYNAVPYGAAFRNTAWVYALQQNTENRSNLALVNTGEVDGGDSVFELEIYDGNTGQRVNTVTGIRVPARGWHQINLILGSYAPGTTQGYVRIRKTAGSNPFLAYGVVNDGGAPGQRSGDGAYLPAAGD